MTLKYCCDEMSGATGCLREECLDVDASPVYLEFSGLSKVVVTVEGNRTHVTVT